MALGKRQKTLIGVFLLGLMALVADRVFLRPQGGAGKVSAESSESYGASPLPQGNAHLLSDEAQSPTVAQRLDRLWSGQEANNVSVRDPFSLEGSWLASSVEGLVAVPDPLAAFAKAHPLVAVVMNGRQSYALVNDRVLKPGDQIDGFTLVSVGPKSAILERQGEQVLLELAGK